MALSQLERIMKNLRCTREEAEQVLADDKAIDQGKRMDFDLPPEEEKKAMKYANADEHKKPQEPAKRTRQENATKGQIVAELATFLAENCGIACENVQITNKERQISFAVGTDCYELTLVQKRKPK